MTINQALQLGTKKLISKSTSAALDSEVLLAFVTKKDKSYLFAHAEQELPDSDAKEYAKLIAKRARRIPVAYLTGYKEFMGLRFAVNKNVLIPRPETETLVEKIIELAEKKKGLNILDIGTGSGAIIISLAHRFSGQHNFFASDVSEKALEIARSNAKNLAVPNIEFRKGSLLKAWSENFDIIAANLPYLPEKTLTTKFEPKLALVAKNKGLHLIQNLIMEIKKLGHKPSFVLLEINFNQRLDIKHIVENYLPAYRFKCIQDYQGFDRIILLTKKEQP